MKNRKKILIANAGGAPAENVVMSLMEEGKEELIGMGSEVYDLTMSKVDRKYLIPYAKETSYKEKLIRLLNKEKPDLLHYSNDSEAYEASLIRDDILSTGTKLFIPRHEVIECCVYKEKSYAAWKKAGMKVPKTMFINNKNDLKKAFGKLANSKGEIWIRAIRGGAGKGALPTNCYEFAKLWIDRYDGWGSFTAAEVLTPQSVTFLSIWHEGELVVGQTRRRILWNFGNRTLSGITGITGAAETFTDPIVTKVSLDSILSIDKKPHGLYGVDMTYDESGFPNPTEINIARFFTTVYFFTKAGLNMPKIYKDIALYNKFPNLKKKINPLPDGLMWLRGMDRAPMLTNEKEIKESINIL